MKIFAIILMVFNSSLFSKEISLEIENSIIDEVKLETFSSRENEWKKCLEGNPNVAYVGNKLLYATLNGVAFDNSIIESQSIKEMCTNNIKVDGKSYYISRKGNKINVTESSNMRLCNKVFIINKVNEDEKTKNLIQLYSNNEKRIDNDIENESNIRTKLSLNSEIDYKNNLKDQKRSCGLVVAGERPGVSKLVKINLKNRITYESVDWIEAEKNVDVKNILSCVADLPNFSNPKVLDDSLMLNYKKDNKDFVVFINGNNFSEINITDQIQENKNYKIRGKGSEYYLSKNKSEIFISDFRKNMQIEDVEAKSIDKNQALSVLSTSIQNSIFGYNEYLGKLVNIDDENINFSKQNISNCVKQLGAVFPKSKSVFSRTEIIGHSIVDRKFFLMSLLVGGK